MIQNLVHTALLVRDYDPARDFYCEKLGFELVEDTMLRSGKRWVRIRAPGGGGSDILLSRAATPVQQAIVGKQAGGRVLFFLQTDDFQTDYRKLKDAGIEFVEEPRRENYGDVAVFKDLYGNRIDLIQLAPAASSNIPVMFKYVTVEKACGTEPILCAPLIRKVDRELIGLLRSLNGGEWDAQTVAPAWKVRDVVAHLLDTALRKLSLVRDAWFVEQVEIRSPDHVIALVNRLNKEGVAVYRRLSPPLLIELMESACKQSAAFHEALDPFAPAAFPVSWAGEDRSANWFDTARELTERWHHQQQIRLATNRPGLMLPELYHAVLDCFLRGLPHLFRGAEAPSGSTVLLEIPGEAGGKWVLQCDNGTWQFTEAIPLHPASHVIVPPELAWRIFTKGIDRGRTSGCCNQWRSRSWRKSIEPDIHRCMIGSLIRAISVR